MLLREMQHRVKNSFQLILASIAIQKRRHPTEDVLRALDHVASRINAISLAHDQLAPREEGQIVKLPDIFVLSASRSSSKPRVSTSMCRRMRWNCRSTAPFRSVSF